LVIKVKLGKWSRLEQLFLGKGSIEAQGAQRKKRRKQ